MGQTIADIASEIEAAGDEAQAAGELEWGLKCYRWALKLRAALDLPAAKAVLQERTAERTIRSMNVDTTRHASDVKRGATRARRKHPAQRIFYEKGVTITTVAKELGETRARVSSWMADGDGLRPIPAHQAEKLRQRYGVPLSVWKRIAE